ncbi:MAG: phospho-sugar mutase [Bacteroidales bacterium]
MDATLAIVKQRAQEWLTDSFDEATRNEVKRLLEGDEKELVDAFYRDLEFGTGGLRGIMGAGTNRMNIYTVGRATQALANYLKKTFPALNPVKVAVAHDSRNNSRLFAETVAKIFAANGLEVYLFEDLRPTPELSFTIRHFGCQSGVVITASHNPKEYNGYKAYWNDGGQVVPPHDTNIIEEVGRTTFADIRWNGNEHLIKIIGSEVDEIYTDKIKSLSLSPEIVKQYTDIKIVYTPIHGTGVKLVPMALAKYGFTNIIHVPEQDIPDGNFPTVKSPNPEESAALTLAIEKARQTGAELVMATDPDADRVGIAVKYNNDFVLLNGNQTGSLLIYYLLTRWNENKKLTGKEYVVKTIVTTDLIADIARKFNVECYEVLTGFKYIAEIIRENEGKKTFIGGGEESYGYLAGEFVRDKDAVMACALIAEAYAWAKSKNKSMFDLLLDMYVNFGFYKESLINVTKKGKEGQEEIARMMDNYRQRPPRKLGGSEVVKIYDYQHSTVKDAAGNVIASIQLPKSNVLQFVTADGSKITVRPSGTEPKIKFYFSVKSSMSSVKQFAQLDAEAAERIQTIAKELGL